jgi:hypothetical protein
MTQQWVVKIKSQYNIHQPLTSAHGNGARLAVGVGESHEQHAGMYPDSAVAGPFPALATLYVAPTIGRYSGTCDGNFWQHLESIGAGITGHAP